MLAGNVVVTDTNSHGRADTVATVFAAVIALAALDAQVAPGVEHNVPSSVGLGAFQGDITTSLSDDVAASTEGGISCVVLLRFAVALLLTGADVDARGGTGIADAVDGLQNTGNFAEDGLAVAQMAEVLDASGYALATLHTNAGALMPLDPLLFAGVLPRIGDDVAAGNQANVTAGIEVAALLADISTGADVEVFPGTNLASRRSSVHLLAVLCIPVDAEIGNTVGFRELPAQAGLALLVPVLGARGAFTGQDVDVAVGLHAHRAFGGDVTSDDVDITRRGHAHIAPCGDLARSVDGLLAGVASLARSVDRDEVAGVADAPLTALLLGIGGTAVTTGDDVDVACGVELAGVQFHISPGTDATGIDVNVAPRHEDGVVAPLEDRADLFGGGAVTHLFHLGDAEGAGLALATGADLVLLGGQNGNVPRGTEHHVIARLQLAAGNHQIAAAVQANAAVFGLADVDGEVFAGLNHRIDIGFGVALGHLGFALAERPFLLLVEVGVLLVLRGDDGDVALGIQGHVSSALDLAADHAKVLPRIQRHIATGGEDGGLLLDPIVLALGLARVAIAVTLIRRRGEGDVAAGAQRRVAGSIKAAGNGVEVAPGADVEVAPGAGFGAQLGGGFAVVAAAVELAVGDFYRGDVDVALGADEQIATALQHATEVADVTAGTDVEAARGLDAGGAVGEAGGPGAVGALRAVDAGDAAFVDHVAGQRGKADVTPGDDAAGGVADAVVGKQVEAVAGLYQPAVAQVAGTGAEVVAGAQGAGVVECAAADEGDVLALDQRAGGAEAVLGLGEVEHRDENLLAVHFGFFEPDDVVGQGRDLLGGEADADGELQAVLVGDGVVHQVAEQGFVAGHAVDEALAGARGDGLLDQALFVEAVAKALLGFVRVVAELAEQVVGAQEALQAGELGVGLDQVLVAVAGGCAAGQPLHAGDVEAVAGGGIGGGCAATQSDAVSPANGAAQRLLALAGAEVLAVEGELPGALHAASRTAAALHATQAEQAVAAGG